MELLVPQCFLTLQLLSVLNKVRQCSATGVEIVVAVVEIVAAVVQAVAAGAVAPLLELVPHSEVSPLPLTVVAVAVVA